MEKFQAKAWQKYGNRIRDSMGKGARRIASAGYGLGCEVLSIHRLYTKDGRMAPFVRGRQKTTLNIGQRRRALINAVESEGLPHAGVDPAGTSANCLRCGGKLRHSVAPAARNERNMWCQSCRAIRERDANAGANILFHTILQLLEDAGRSGIAGRRNITLPAILLLPGEAVGSPDVGERQRITIHNILRLLEGHSADAEWRLPRAHKPGRQNPAGGEPVGGPGWTVPAGTGRGRPVLPGCAIAHNL